MKLAVGLRGALARAIAVSRLRLAAAVLADGHLLRWRTFLLSLICKWMCFGWSRRRARRSWQTAARPTARKKIVGTVGLDGIVTMAGLMAGWRLMVVGFYPV